MKCIALAVTIVVGLILLLSSFVLPLDHSSFVLPLDHSSFVLPLDHSSFVLSPEGSVHAMQGGLSKVPETSNEPLSQTSVQTLTPSFNGHVPMTIGLGNSSDLSFIYEGRKLAYVQFYSKDQDRVTRITHDEYRRLGGTGRPTNYDAFIPVPGQGQERADGLGKYIASVQGVVQSLRRHAENVINRVRAEVRL